MMYKISKKRIEDTAIVVIDGTIYTLNGVDDSKWIKIMEACENVNQAPDFEVEVDEYEELLDLLVPSRVKQREEEEEAFNKALEDSQLELDFDKRMKKAKRIADISDSFEYDEQGVPYLKGFKHPIPRTLAEALLDANYNPNSNYTVESLINFWKYLLLNPDKHVRKGLFDWIATGKFAITEDGNIIAYRNVDIKKQATNKKLQDFISESWAKIKRWKKSCKNYSVILDSDGMLNCVLTDKLDEADVVTNHGVLSDLYADLDTEEDVTIYKPWHPGPYGQEIILGKEVTMPREETDNDPDASCSEGLHCKSTSYGLNLGSEVLVTLVNPYKVVAIPSYDHSKFRSCGYLPFAKAEVVDGRLIEFDNGSYDIPYNGLKSLVDLLKTESLEDLQEQGLVSKEIEAEDFKFVMDKAREVISKRTVVID